MVQRMKILGFGALVAVAAFASAQGLKLAFKPTVNEEIKYSVKAVLEVSGTSATMTGTQSQKTLDVDKDGNYTVEVKLIDGKLEFGGQQMDLPATPGMVSVMKKDGTVKEIRGDSVEGNTYRFANLQSMILPDKELKTGDEWTSESKANSTTGAVAFKASYKLAGEEKIGAFDTVKITYSVKETDGDAPATAEGTTWLDKTTGMLVKAEQKLTNAPIPGAPVPVSGTFTITRI